MHRSLVDLLDRGFQLGVELLVGLALSEPFEERAREAGDQGGVAREQGARLVAAVTARQGDDPEHARVGRRLPVQAGLGRDGDLQHDQRAFGQRLDMLGDRVAQQRLRLLLVRAGDADLRLHDRDEARGADPPGVLELLVYDRRDPGLVGVIDHRPHLGPENTVPVRALEQIIKGVDGLHELHVVLLGGQALVDFQERHHVLLVLQILRGGDAVDVPFHGLLEQDRRENARAIERRACQHAAPHGVDQVEHLGVGAVAIAPDAVIGERLGRAATALVKGGEKTAAGPDLLQLRSVHPSAFCHQPDSAGQPGGGQAVQRAGDFTISAMTFSCPPAAPASALHRGS